MPGYESPDTVINSFRRRQRAPKTSTFEETWMTNSPYEIPAEMRDFAEKSVSQARKAFEGFMGAAQKAASTVDSTTHQAQSQAKDLSSKAVSYAEQNIN